MGVLSLSSCVSPGSHRVTRSQPLLGTYFVITAEAPDNVALSAMDKAFAEVRRLDKILSIHREDSELAVVNRSASNKEVSISPELFEVLQTAAEIYRKTEGAFDVTIRPLANLYGFIWKQYRLPSEMELKKVLPKVNGNDVILDPNRKTVFFQQRGITIDLGAIGKGYAVDRVVEILKENGVNSGMVRAGGDLRVFGERTWEVQIEDPQKQGKRKTVHLQEKALSTSGNYENFFMVNGVRYAHILNPRTGLPVQGVIACTVQADRCIYSDALATACFVLGPEKTERIFGPQFPREFVVEK